MASLLQRNGKWTLQLRLGQRQKAIGLGAVNRVAAERIKVRVEQLLAEHRLAGQPSPDSLTWLRSLGTELRRRFAAAGLLERDKTIAELCAAFEDRGNRKASTMTAYNHTLRNLVDCYGADAAAVKIDANAFRSFLLEQSLSPATVNKRISIARSVFKPITPNPFAAIVAGGQQNPRRQSYVTPAQIEHIMEYADAELRLALAFARFGGLRIPSELQGMRWSDIQFSANRFYVRSPKTEHHAGGAGRFVPIFPKLRGPLLDAFGAAPEGQPMVFPTQADVSNSALRTRLSKLMKRLGITPWPRLWQNMRASWETDVVRLEPAAAAKWAGHSPQMAAAHYHMVDDAAFDRASGAQTLAQTSAEVSSGLQGPQTTTCSVNTPAQTTYNTTELGAVGLEPTKRALQKSHRAKTGANRATKLARIYQRTIRRKP